MNKKVRIGSEVLLVVVAAIISLCAEPVKGQSLLEVQKALIGFAGLVVTIFGIWIAVIFPVLSGLLVDGKAKQEVSQLVRYDVLVQALYRACFCLTASFFVFLILSFCSTYSDSLVRAASFFSWLVFVATAWALWSAVWNGEGAVVGGIDDSLKKGVVKRFRSLGRTAKSS
jgi:hypothetical protein